MSDITNLVTALGGDTKVLAFYDRRNGETLSAGKLSTWDDARGAIGFGPQLIGQGSPLPAVDGSGIITCDGSQNGVVSSTDATFDIANARTIVFVGTIPDNGGSAYTVILWNGGDYNAFLPNGNVFWEGGVERNLLEAGNATNVRLGIISLPASPHTTPGSTPWTSEIWGHVRQFVDTASYSAGGSWKLGLGRIPGVGLFAATKISATIVVDHQLNATEQAALVTWATTYHGAVYDTATGNIIGDGNSIARGFGLTTPTTQNFIAQASADASFTGYEYSDAGVDSIQGVTVAANMPKRILPAFNSARSKNVVVYYEVINDIFHGGYGASAIETHITDYFTSVKAAGFRCVVCTCLPSTEFDAGMETTRLAVNTWIRANYLTFAHAMADVASIPSMSDPNSATYYQDGVHPTLAGATLMASDATFGLLAAMKQALVSTGTSGSFFFGQ